MPIQVTCPGCGRVHAAPDEWAGRTVRCSNCQTRHPVPGARVDGPPAPHAPAAAPPAGPPAAPGAGPLPDEDHLLGHEHVTPGSPLLPPEQEPAPDEDNRPLVWDTESPFEDSGAPAGDELPELLPDDAPAPAAAPYEPPYEEAPYDPPPVQPYAAGELAPPAGEGAEGRPAPAFLGMIDQVFTGMGQALSIRKLTFFLAAAIATLVVCLLLVRVGAWLGTGGALMAGVLAEFLAIGLAGVIAGGVAYLTIEEGQGRLCKLADVATFCGQQFVPLFFGTVLLALGVGLAGGLINGLIALVNMSRTVGSLLGALLFVPQVVVNGALLVLCLVGVLVPCAVVVEQIGPVRAIQRLVTLLIQRPGALLLQFGITLYFGAMMFFVLGFLTFLSLGPALMTNGPSLSSLVPSLPGLGDEGEAGLPGLSSGLDGADLGLGGLQDLERSGFSSARSGPAAKPAAAGGRWGDWLRHLGIGIVLIAVLAFPVVFWICAFARYYESLMASYFAPGSALPAGP